MVCNDSNSTFATNTATNLQLTQPLNRRIRLNGHNRYARGDKRQLSDPHRDPTGGLTFFARLTRRDSQ